MSCFFLPWSSAGDGTLSRSPTSWVGAGPGRPEQCWSLRDPTISCRRRHFSCRISCNNERRGNRTVSDNPTQQEKTFFQSVTLYNFVAYVEPSWSLLPSCHLLGHLLATSWLWRLEPWSAHALLWWSFLQGRFLISDWKLGHRWIIFISPTRKVCHFCEISCILSISRQQEFWLTDNALSSFGNGTKNFCVSFHAKEQGDLFRRFHTIKSEAMHVSRSCFDELWWHGRYILSQFFFVGKLQKAWGGIKKTDHAEVKAPNVA